MDREPDQIKGGDHKVISKHGTTMPAAMDWVALSPTFMEDILNTYSIFPSFLVAVYWLEKSLFQCNYHPCLPWFIPHRGFLYSDTILSWFVVLLFCLANQFFINDLKFCSYVYAFK